MQRLQAAPLSRSAPRCNYNIPFLSNQTNNTTLVWQEATKPGFLFVCYPTLIAASPHPAPARFLQQQPGEVLTPQSSVLYSLLTSFSLIMCSMFMCKILLLNSDNFNILEQIFQSVCVDLINRISPLTPEHKGKREAKVWL